MRNSKQVLRAAVFLLLVAGISMILSFALEPVTYTRVDMHHLRKNRYEDIFVGTSHGFSAIDPEVIERVTGRRTMNACIPGEFPQDAYNIVKEAARNSKIKRVVYEMDLSYLSAPYDIKNSPPVYKELPMSGVKWDYWKEQVMPSDFRMTLFPWYLQCDEYKNAFETMRIKMGAAYRNYSPKAVPGDSKGQYYKGDGFLYINRNEEASKGDFHFNLWDPNELEDDNLKYLERIIKYCKEQGVEFVLIVTPVPKETVKHYEKVWKEEDAYCQELAEKWDVRYYNFNYIDKNLDKSVKHYTDYDGHMFGEQAEEFSKILGEYLND